MFTRDAAFALALANRAKRAPDEMRWMELASDPGTLKAAEAMYGAWLQSALHPGLRESLDAVLRPHEASEIGES